MPSLRELQMAFFAALESGAAGATRVSDDLRAVVASGGGGVGHGDVVGRDGLDADGRIAVYVEMYWRRIVDVLRDDFPRTATVIGDDAFGTLARAYLAATPSRHASLRHVGGGFADHVAACAPAGLPPFVADLARLEWARLDVFDAPDSDVLTRADMRRVAADDWGNVLLRPIPALAVLQLGWPVHTVWPDDATVTTLAPAPTTLRVWRDGYRVFQAPMATVESAALALLRGRRTPDGARPDDATADPADARSSVEDAAPTGATFADVCAVLAAATAPAEAAEHAAALLLRWIDDRLLAAPAS